MYDTISDSRRYYGLNGLRMIACLGIVIMHVKANSYISINPIIDNIIKEFTNFVFLFMMLSPFSMCCGYYKKIKNNEINFEEFYKKRFKKILPFFIFLSIIDVLFNYSLASVIEAFANSTLMFGFLQKKIEVLGVGWFLGLIFIFYMIFPFFVFLFSNRTRAWFVTVIALIMNVISINYFNVERTNMFYSFIYFCIGGLLYLYKNEIIKVVNKHRIISLFSVLIAIILYFNIPKNESLLVIRIIPLCSVLISYSISVNSRLLDNKITKFIGEISLEIYLVHMVILRGIEKVHLTHICGNNYLSYILCCVLVMCGAIIFAIIFRNLYKKIKEQVLENENINC